MSKIIIHYPNCSKGGVSSVIRGRAVASPDTEFHFVAFYDKGGRESFKDLSNVKVHIVEPSRFIKWIDYVLSSQSILELSVLSSPGIVDELQIPDTCKLVYEFHTSDLSIIESELDGFDTSRPDSYRCPTQTMASAIRRIADKTVSKKLKVVPNLVDTRYFNMEEFGVFDFAPNERPLIWVGRLDKGKGLKYALRTLAQLPSEYSLHAVFSLTDSPLELSDFLGEAYSLGVQDRFFLYQNLSQELMASLFRSAAQSSGALLSTSLNESYGYFFHEATATGLPIFAFDLPVITEFTHVSENTLTVPPGDIYGLATQLLAQDHLESSDTSTEDKTWLLPRWHDFMENRIQGNEKGIPWFLHDKLKAFQFCEEHGFPAAEVLRVFDTPDEIDLSGFAGDFVLKPTLQSSTKGVMVLTPIEGGFYDSLRKRELTIDDIVQEQSVLFDRTKASGKKIIVEEKIADLQDFPIPRDFKAYAFRGEIAFMLEIDRNTSPSTVAWSDGDFQPLRDGTILCDKRFVREMDSRMPPFAVEMIDLARRVSAKVPTPFARIDMYLTERGPLVGEITLTPGGFYYGKHYTLSEVQERVLGKMWLDAEAKTLGGS